MKKEDLINAREIQKVLKSKSQFSDWIKRNLKLNKLKINEDYFTSNEKIPKTNLTKTYKKNYYLTEEAAKQIMFSQFANNEVQKVKCMLGQGMKLNEIVTVINKEKLEAKIINFDNEEYPEQLRKIKNPPKQLYVKGNLQNLKEIGIAVIGTRHCSNYGRRICKSFTNNFVGYNLNIISGLATGIDACAHKACLEAKGKTIAVLPSGFNHIFPKENEELLNKILANGGTAITEYPPEFEKTPESCRERNRIVSGLAIGTLVIEAGKCSGTSITVRHTNEQNKKAFCIPSSLLNSKGTGTNQMIKENKAQIVTEVEDIIKEFPELKLERRSNFNFVKLGQEKSTTQREKKSKVNLEIEEENLEIYNSLTEEPKTIDEIAQILNKPTQEITYKLTLLELQGAIEELPGKKFKIK